MWEASRSRRSVPAIGNASRPAWAPKASASSTGLACPWSWLAPLSTMAQAIGGRWHIEEDLQACKDLGLDQYARPQLPRLVSAYYPRAAGSRLPRRHHGSQPPHSFCPICGVCDQRPSHSLDHLRSASSAGSSHLAGSYLRVLDLSVVDFSAHPPLLGWLLSSSPPRKSRLSLCGEPVFPSQEKSWESSVEFS